MGERGPHAAGDATEMVSTCASVALAIFRASTVWGEQLQQGYVCLPKQPRHVKLVKLGQSPLLIFLQSFTSFTSFTQIPTSFRTSSGQVSQVSHVCVKAGVSKPLQVVHVCGLSKASLSKVFARRQRDGAERRARTQKTMDSLREMSGVSSYSKAMFAFQSSLDT